MLIVFSFYASCIISLGKDFSLSFSIHLSTMFFYNKIVSKDFLIYKCTVFDTVTAYSGHGVVVEDAARKRELRLLKNR